MLLALDAGNTNITIGVYRGAELLHRWRLRTVHEQTADEWGIFLRNLFSLERLELASIDGIIVASVVPPVNSRLAEMARRYFNCDPMFVTSDTNTGLTIRYENPREVGADRIVNGVAAFAKYGGPSIVVDLGTAITFDCVSARAEYLGGMICPGIGISIDALFTRTARLPLVDFSQPEKLIGTTTSGSIRSGLYYGMLGMIDGILQRLLAEMGAGTRTVATGGQADLIVQASRYVHHSDPDLTLEGLRLIWERTHQLPAAATSTISPK
ncbi:MAG TPA: type III pantothenate kinase [Bryobacteraceae bacterium]|nr:type III pantothenate kinase [Bryobacteraceae bacterium]